MSSLILNCVSFVVKLWFQSIILFIFSILFYVLIYFWYIPNYEALHPIYFQYDVACKSQQMLSATNQIESNTTELQNRLMPNCQFVHYEFDNCKANFFQNGQSYYFKIRIQMPDSEVNQNVGMFTIRLRLFDTANNQLFAIGRPAILPYKSTLVRRVQQVLYIVPLILNLFTETTSLLIDLIDNNVALETSIFTQIDRVRLEIETLKQIEIIPPSQLQITAHLSGPKYYMYFWPLTTAIVSIVSMFSTMLSTVITTSFFRTVFSTEDELLASENVGDIAGNTNLLLASRHQHRRGGGVGLQGALLPPPVVPQFDPSQVTSFEPDSSGQTGPTTDKS